MKPYNVAIVLGTRPEAIKLAPLILAMRGSGSPLRPLVCVTGQHREMLDPILKWFDITADHDMQLMQANQTLPDLSARVLVAAGELFRAWKPNTVVVQGDTTTAAFASLAAFYQQIPVAHVEAGLRTGSRYQPFPEEVNRRIISVLTTWHFAPTERAADALRAEQVSPDNIFTVGNTVVDALRLTVDRAREMAHGETINRLDTERLILVTAHRRESFGPPMERICRAVRKLVEVHSNVEIQFPVHLNPQVRETVYGILNAVPRVRLMEPVNYQQFVQLMLHSTLILTDSGGIQEEAAALGKPTLVMRDGTERQEAIESGTAILVGTDEQRILSAAHTLLTDRDALASMSKPSNAFGDGFAAQAIVDILHSRLAR